MNLPLYQPGTVVLSENVMFKVILAQKSASAWLYKSERVGIEAIEEDITHTLIDGVWTPIS